jgi:hypothetical protein
LTNRAISIERIPFPANASFIGDLVGNTVRLEPSGVILRNLVKLSLGINESAFDLFPGLSAFYGIRRQSAPTANERIANSYFLFIHRLNTSVIPNRFQPVGPTWVFRDREDGIWKAFAFLSSFSVYSPIVRKGMPTVPEYNKAQSSSGDEVYVTSAMAGFLVMLMILVIMLPWFMTEEAMPPPPPKIEPPKVVSAQPIIISPPPPPPAPVFVRELEPQIRYNVQGAPIKHFGPPIGGDSWKPAPQNEYSVPIRTNPDTEGQLGFHEPYATAYSEVRKLLSPFFMSRRQHNAFRQTCV